MTQDERWLSKYNEIISFIETSRRNPSKYDAEERGFYCNWLRHNKKLYYVGDLKEERMELLKEMLELSKKYKRKKQQA